MNKELKIILKAVDQTKGAINSVSDRVTKMGGKMTNVGKQMSMKLTAPIVAFGGLSMKTFADFEDSLNKMVGLVGVSRDQVEEWKDEMKELSTTTGISANELADAMFFVTSAGLRGEEAMKVLEMSAKASASGLGETETISDLLTSAVNAYGAENLSAAQATDILTATVREGKAEASELTSAMGQVLPIASEMGVSFDQVGGAIAGMTRTGTDASTASIQLRQILTSLLKPTSEAREQMGEFGLSASGIRKSIREDGLISTLGLLKENFGENEEATAKVFGNVRALSGVMDLLGTNSEENIKIFDATKDSTGLLETAFKETDGTTREWNMMLANLKNLMLEIAEEIKKIVLPIMKYLGKQLEKVKDWWNTLSDSQKEWIVIIGILIAAIGPALMILGILTTVIGAIVSPVGLVILAIGALISIAVLMVKKIQGLIPLLKAAWDHITDIFFRAIDSITAYFQPLFDLINRIVDLAKSIGSTVKGAVGGAIGKVGDLVGLAEGGIVTRPTLAMVGEAGPEAVVPLKKNGGLGGITININGGNFLSENVADELADSIMYKLKLQGRV